jgi:hypothetical protein
VLAVHFHGGIGVEDHVDIFKILNTGINNQG